MLETFVQLLLDRYSITVKENGNPVETEELRGIINSFQALQKKKCEELKRECQSRELATSGTKDQMILRLLGVEGIDLREVAEAGGQQASSKKRRKSGKKEVLVLDRMIADIPLLTVRRNKFGNFAIPGEGFVLDEQSREVIGKQADDGSIVPLTLADVEFLREQRLAFLLPSNLGTAE